MLAPATTTSVQVDELRGVVEELLSDYYGEPAYIRRFHRRLSLYSSSYRIENLDVDLLDQGLCRLVLKDTSPAAVTNFEHHVRPSWVCSPEREIEVYREILPSDLGAPVCYGAFASSELERFWLFLERVPGAALWQMGQLEVWRDAARWLACFHSRLKSLADESPQLTTSCLIRYDEMYLRLWINRAEKFQRRMTAEPRQAKAFERLVARYDTVLDELQSLPQTFIHGEFYPSNVLVRRPRKLTARRGCQRPASGLEICPIDWEMAGIGPGAVDLAALTSGKWPSETRLSMIAAYREALQVYDQDVPALSDLVRAVEVCQLHLAVQWLGWGEEWAPPERHAQDWLEEALHLAKHLGY